MYTLVKRTPGTTRLGKTAQNAKYEVFHDLDGEMKSMSLGAVCRANGLCIPSIITTLRTWPAGTYGDKFDALVGKMKRRKAQIGANSGARFTCPHCGGGFTRRDALYAKRRKWREASPVGSVLRAKPAEFFGEAL